MTKTAIDLKRFLLLFFPFVALSAPLKNSGEIESWFHAGWEHSPDIKEAQGKVEFSEAVDQQSWSAFYPSLSVKYIFRDNAQTANVKTFSLYGEQVVFGGFKDFYTQAATGKLLESERYALASTKNSISKAVADALLSLALAEAKKATYDENATLLDARLKEFKRRTKIGRARDVELIENKLARIKLERGRLNNDQDFLQAKLNLKELTGREVAKAPLAFDQIIQELVQYHGQLPNFSPQRKVLQEKYAAQEEKVKAARSTYLPTIKAVAAYYPDNRTKFSNVQDDWSIGFDFEWKFFEGFNGMSGIDQNRATRAQASAQLEKFELGDTDLRQQLKTQWTQVTAERKLLLEGETLSREELRAQARDFRLGLVTVLELSTVDENYLELKLERLAVEQKLGTILTQAIERGGIEGLTL